MEKRQHIIAWFQEAVAAGKLEEDASSDEDIDAVEDPDSWAAADDSDCISVTDRRKPSLTYARTRSEQSACEDTNLESRSGTTTPLSAEQGPGETVIRAVPALKSSDNPSQVQELPRGEKSLRLRVSYLTSRLRSKDRQLLRGAAHGDIGEVRALLDDGANTEARGRYAETALILAIYHSHRRTVRLLLDGSAKVDSMNASGITALCYAAARDERIDIVQMLLDNNADVDKRDGESPPLGFAAFFGSVAILRLLIGRGADTEAMNEYGDPALHAAAGAGMEKSVEILLEKGAVIDAMNRNGFTALRVATAEGKEEVVKILLKKGANVEVIDPDGSTPLHWVARWDKANIAKLLLKYEEARIGALDEDGQTPLQLGIRA
jgi:ankyrin repeat protein